MDRHEPGRPVALDHRLIFASTRRPLCRTDGLTVRRNGARTRGRGTARCPGTARPGTPRAHERDALALPASGNNGNGQRQARATPRIRRAAPAPIMTTDADCTDRTAA